MSMLLWTLSRVPLRAASLLLRMLRPVATEEGAATADWSYYLSLSALIFRVIDQKHSL
jgi:hypothetical protein